MKRILTSLAILIPAGNAAAQPVAEDAVQASAQPNAERWNTTGLKQANSMGGGEAPIPATGKLRVFVLMGQSNMNGAGRAAELKPPYTEKHDRIRIWANGRWEYLVPGQPPQTKGSSNRGGDK